jgi:hypothetical protein
MMNNRMSLINYIAFCFSGQFADNPCTLGGCEHIFCK